MLGECRSYATESAKNLSLTTCSATLYHRGWEKNTMLQIKATGPLTLAFCYVYVLVLFSVFLELACRVSICKLCLHGFLTNCRCWRFVWHAFNQSTYTYVTGSWSRSLFSPSKGVPITKNLPSSPVPPKKWVLPPIVTGNMKTFLQCESPLS